MDSERFPFRFDRAFRPLLRVTVGATPDNSVVTVDDEMFEARFGRLTARTALSNIKDVQITRDYQWHKAIGARGSFADRGATFGSSVVGGVCICVHEPIGALLGAKVRIHPGLTVTVEDLDGLAEAIRRRL